jgi:hypothetical protein
MCLQLSEELGLQLTRLELVSLPRLVSVFEVGPFHPMILRGLRSRKTPRYLEQGEPEKVPRLFCD